MTFHVGTTQATEVVREQVMVLQTQGLRFVLLLQQLPTTRGAFAPNIERITDCVLGRTTR